jgi:pheromone a factor receptor
MYFVPVLLIISSLLVVIFSIQPLVWQISHNNVASAFLISWIMLRNTFDLINAILWPSVESLISGYTGVGLCDIEVKLKIASDITMFACAAAVLRNLANILDTSRTDNLLSLSKRQRIIDQTVTWTLCAGVPIITMVLHYLVQPSRYMLMVVSGCQFRIDNSWLTIVVIYVPRILVALLGMYYAGQSHLPSLHLSIPK